MNDSDKLRSLIISINERIGSVPSTPADFNALSFQIGKATGHPVSSSTLKRLWGYVPYTSMPSPNTLNTLCLFLGYGGWNSFIMSGDQPVREEETSDFFEKVAVDIDTLVSGDVLNVEWGQDKGCRIEYSGNHRFLILESKNIKLQPGDTLTLQELKVGSPFYAVDIRRGELAIPGYVGARGLGISRIV